MNMLINWQKLIYVNHQLIELIDFSQM